MKKSLNSGNEIKHKRLISIARSACLLLFLSGCISLMCAASVELVVDKVRIYNQMDTPIWVIVAENQKHVTAKETKTVGSVEFEIYYKYMVEGSAKIPIEGVPVDATVKNSSEFKNKLYEYWEKHQKEEFEWSGFIKPGALEIAPGKFNDFSLKGDEQIYYITIRTNKPDDLDDLATATPRSEKIIYVDSTGHINDGSPGGEQIKNGMQVYFESKAKVIGDPQTANNNWDAGTFGNTKGSHQIVTWNGQPLEQGMFVRIITNSKTLKTANYKYMYSAQRGWVYYDKKRDKTKQQWKISKTNDEKNSPGDNLHYGDQVKISNGKWPKANLGKKDKWLQCVNDEPSVWTLTK
ncbi:MAG: hypothetical protein IH852_08720 [Bacteroidetes bacterium]|nr:hypothetical protein [Bacteroidota bacterium]